MKPIWADAMKAENIEEASRFLAHTEGNLFDPAVLAYPATKVLKTSDGNRNLVYMPVQQCQVWESLGINPEATELETAASLKALAQILRFMANADGQKEIYFLCSHELTQKFAERHGFERVTTPVFRMKL